MIVSVEDFPKVRAEHQNARIVLTGGTFDVLHPGHIEYLKWARARGDLLVVLVNNDESVRNRKGPDRPVNNEDDRLHVIEALKPVDYCALSDKYVGALAQFGSALQPNVFVVYNDWVPADVDTLQRAFPSTEVIVCDLSKTHSTTALLDKLAQK